MLDIIPQRSKTIKVGNIFDAINFSLGLNLIWKNFLHCYKFFLWCKISFHKQFFHGSNSSTRNISTLGHNHPLSQNTPLTFNTPMLKYFNSLESSLRMKFYLGQFSSLSKSFLQSKYPQVKNLP